MKVIQQQDNTIVLRFDKGEEFIQTFSAFLKEQDIKGAFFYGLGGATQVKVAYYRLSKKEYQYETISGDHLEITSITGNVALLNNEYRVHNHINFSDQSLNVHGGHCEELMVGGTLEIHLTVLNEMKREQDENIGLALLTKT